MASQIYLSGEEKEDGDGKRRCYGYLMTGSQYVSYACWGNRDAGNASTGFTRFQLAVAIFPFTDDRGLCSGHCTVLFSASVRFSLSLVDML